MSATHTAGAGGEVVIRRTSRCRGPAMVARRSEVRTAHHCDTSLAPGSLGEDYPSTICARDGRLSRLDSTFLKIVPGAGQPHSGRRIAAWSAKRLECLWMALAGS